MAEATLCRKKCESCHTTTYRQNLLHSICPNVVVVSIHNGKNLQMGLRPGLVRFDGFAAAGRISALWDLGTGTNQKAHPQVCRAAKMQPKYNHPSVSVCPFSLSLHKILATGDAPCPPASLFRMVRQMSGFGFALGWNQSSKVASHTVRMHKAWPPHGDVLFALRAPLPWLPWP